MSVLLAFAAAFLFASGTYLLRVEGPGVVRMRKLTLVR